jgi:protease PrsW
MKNPDETKQLVGWVLYWLLMLVGGVLLLALFLVPPLLGPNAGLHYYYMGVGAACALPMLAVYLWTPWVIDRYDPQPVWALMTVLAWGGVAAVGFSACINTFGHAYVAANVGKKTGEFFAACVSAPLVEEFWKALAFFWMFYFRKREFNGIVEGIISATFVALGFAAVENIIYYSQALEREDLHNVHAAFAITLFGRGIMSPWVHPLFTSMTGLGFGIARETANPWLKWFAPLVGYCGAIFLHFVWNFGSLSKIGFWLLPLWLILILAFFVLVLWCVRRKGKIIVEHLKDEVLLGNLTANELALIGSPVGRLKANWVYGGVLGREFVDTASRLALSKWHSGTAMRAKKVTVSADSIVPLRQDLHRLRAQIAKALGRAIEQPKVRPAPQARNR